MVRMDHAWAAPLGLPRLWPSLVQCLERQASLPHVRWIVCMIDHQLFRLLQARPWLVGVYMYAHCTYVHTLESGYTS